MTSADDTQPNYKDTLHLPKTDFPMKAGLPRKEPEILARWQAMDLYGRQRAAARGGSTKAYAACCCNTISMTKLP